MAEAVDISALAGQFLTAVIGGAVGGVFGTGFKWVEQHSERVRRRKALATSMLNDLRGLELHARQLREADYAARGTMPGSQPGDVIRRVVASDDLHLFAPNTVSHLHYLASLVAALAEVPALYAKVTNGGDRAALNTRARAQAHFIATHIIPAKIALQREGGTVPSPEPIDVAVGLTLPPLGPPGFPEWSFPPDIHDGGKVWVNDAGRPRPDT